MDKQSNAHRIVNPVWAWAGILSLGVFALALGALLLLFFGWDVSAVTN